MPPTHIYKHTSTGSLNMIGSLFYWGIAPLSKPPWGHPCCIGGSPPWFWGVGEGFINTPIIPS